MNDSIIWHMNEDKKRLTTMLIISQKCNLNCKYCYESFKTSKLMDFETAKQAILKGIETVKNDERFECLEVQLMGGEPFTNYPLIKALVEWDEENHAIPCPHIFFVPSNGTLFTDEIKAWCRAHKQTICVGVSWDGTSTMQRTNRGSDDIDFKFFHDTWPNQNFHMTVSKQTLPSLAEGILEIQRRDYKLDAALASGVDFTAQDAAIYNRQLALLAEAYLEDETLPPINLLSRYLYLPDDAEKLQEPQRKYCGTGSHMVTYDVDGKQYGCHMFTPLVLGDKATQRDCIDWKSRLECNEDPFCRECVLKYICPTCCGFNLRYRGDIALRDHSMCRMFFVQTLRSCEFQIKAVLARRTALNGIEEAKYAKAAYDAYHVLKALEPKDLNDPEQIPNGPYKLT